MSVLRFHGTITGLGSSSGVRIVVGEWTESPYAAFVDVMLAEPDGTRHLLAASPEVAQFVGGTYRFDQVHVVPLERRHEGPVVRITAGDLVLRYRIGRRTHRDVRRGRPSRAQRPLRDLARPRSRLPPRRHPRPRLRLRLDAGAPLADHARHDGA